MHSLLVRDYMDNNPHAIPENSTVRDVVKFLIRENLSGAPVVDTSNNLIGFVSEQDCMKEVLNDAFYADESPSVRAVMTESVSTTAPDVSIVEMAEKMTDSATRNYPVVKQGKLIGLITRTAILNAVVEYNEGVYFHRQPNVARLN